MPPRTPHPPLALFAASISLVLPLAFSPTLESRFWAPRLLLVLCLAAVGIPLAASLARTEYAARFGVAFAGFACLSAAFASRPLLSVLGRFGGAGGVVLMVAMVGAWAIGRHIADQSQRLVGHCLIAALAANLFVVGLQQTVSLSTLRLEQTVGTFGLLGNPVHLGSLIAAVAPLLVYRFRQATVLSSVIAFASGAGLQFSGSRFGTAATVATIILAVVWLRDPSRLLVLALVAAGFTAALLAASVVPNSETSVVRDVRHAESGQLLHRVDTWHAGLDATLDRPLLGYGAGRYLEATSPRTTLRIARGGAAAIYVDAHNVFVEVFTAIGIPGGLAFVAFFVLAARRARGEMALVALGILLLHLLQPLSLATTSLAFLALGLSHQGPAPVLARLPTRLGGPLALLSALVGAYLCVGDWQLRQADLDFSVADGRGATRRLSAWPEPATKLSQIYVFRGGVDARTLAQRERLYDEALEWGAEAVRRDPSVPNAWNNLASLHIFRADLGRANDDFEQALERNPWSVRALVGLAAIADQRGSADVRDAHLRRAAAVVQDDDEVDALFLDQRRRLGS